MPEEPSDLSILFDLFAAGQRMKRLLTAAMVESPLGPEEYAAYSVIFERGPLTPTDMAKTLGMPVTTVLDLLRTVAARGHIERQPNPDDGRSYLISLTDAGVQTQQAASLEFARAMTPLAFSVGVEETEMRRALDVLSRAMEDVLKGLDTDSS